MASKQEKLAAARKKLKEFQGKNKEGEFSRQKGLIKDSASGNNFYSENHYLDKHQNNYVNVTRPSESDNQKFQETNKIENEISSAFSTQSNQPYECNNLNVSNETDRESCKKDVDTELLKSTSSEHESCAESNKKACEFQNIVNITDLNVAAEERSIAGQRMESNSLPTHKINDLLESENSYISQFENSSSDKDLSKVVERLQEELKNYAQTINVLVYQRNDIQNCLLQNQSLLNEKTEEVEKLKQHLLNSDSTINSVNKKVLEAEELVKKLTAEKEDTFRKNIDNVALVESLKHELSSKEEEFVELQRKFLEKNKECENLLTSLQKTQSQLSLCQIQLHQFTATDSSSLTVKVSELQKENLHLTEKIKDLEVRIEASREENEESSHKFHSYAQQCNSQLSSLNSQVEVLKLENEKLRKDNEILTNDLFELENLKKEVPQQQNVEIGNLHSEIHNLTQEINTLTSDLNKKDNEVRRMSAEVKEKCLALENMEKIVEEVKAENKRLVLEAKNPEANERLLAAMESDKVAAAKAVSQNLKLKNQVVELEKAFLKMSEEKLKLTDELAHERHVNAELQKVLDSSKGSDHNDEHSHSQCHHNHEQEPLVNDSNEIEELRSIIRQLQDDKVELKARLNTFESAKVERTVDSKPEETDHVKCENTNLLLQQMEEKVRKTMNEIAVLDEEKEKLEHLVLQLQGETETIGEYITLYQKQRMLLRQRAQEKDKELLQLSRDKEELRSKLATLDDLVQHLIAERQSFGLSPGSLPNSVEKNSEKTAGKIRELINEIGSTSLVKNHTVAFEHCSCCSGRLITL